MNWSLVVAINGFYGRGGTERQIIDIARGFRARGRSVTVVSRWPLDPASENVRDLLDGDVSVVARTGRLPSPVRRGVLKAQSLLAHGEEQRLERFAWRWESRQLAGRAVDPVVIHEIPYFGQIPEPGRLIHARLCLPLVQTILGTPEEQVQPATRWTVLTSDGAPGVPEGWGYLWVPTTTDAPQPRSPVVPDTGRIKLLFVGRLASSKGVAVLLNALRTVPNVELTIAGDGPELDRLQASAADMPQVTFAGSLDRPAVFDAINASHVVVVPSVPTGLAEGLPTVIPEALSQGRPVIASAIGGISRLLAGDDAPGWLVQPGDADELANCLRRLTPEELVWRSERARPTHDRLLRLDAVLDAYERAYGNAMRRAATADRIAQSTQGVKPGPGRKWLSDVELDADPVPAQTDMN